MSEPKPPVDQPRAHEFDGITEYDNALPKWFTALFAISLAWAPLYIAYYHFWTPKLGAERLQDEMAAAAEEKAKRGGALTEDALRGISRNAERIAKGKALYASAGCITCHGPEATGTVGPNLRDKYWIYGSDMLQILDVLEKGRLDKGMLKPLLSEAEAVDLTIYLVDLSRQGEQPGKAIDPSREKEAPITY